MKENYSYPIDPDWSTSEIVTVMDMLQLVEQAYEEGILAERVLAEYKKFKQVIKSISEEKQIGKNFEEASGYALYQVVKMAKEKQTGRMQLKGEC